MSLNDKSVSLLEERTFERPVPLRELVSVFAKLSREDRRAVHALIGRIVKVDAEEGALAADAMLQQWIEAGRKKPARRSN